MIFLVEEAQMTYILHIVASLRIGGAEKVARDIGLYADLSKYENHYIVFGETVGAYEQQLIDCGCKIFHIEYPSVNYRKYMQSLRNILNNYRYTVVHVHTMFNAGWAMYVAKRMRVPVRVTHAHSTLDVCSNILIKVYEIIMRQIILSSATELIACGEKAGIRLFGQKGYRERAHLILNGIDVSAFQFDIEKRKKMRRILNVNDSFAIGHVGHLTEVKNQKFLINIMPQILQIKPNAKLLLIGEGEDRSMLERRIADLELQEKIIMTGNVMNVSEYLNAMDVFAFPSLFEGMPLSVIEVQANGLPCILSNKVPEDVYLTDLVYPLSLESFDEWVDAICNSQRAESKKYAEVLQKKEVDVKSVIKRIYNIYEKIDD